ncbi:MAG: hypothetical protein F4243_07075 [Chloroflexi bacterium]|nr:hypothetical protein [Chloroflexota bacterium]MYE78742.1 hypothetical protein [Chloroflexota bacterium]
MLRIPQIRPYQAAFWLLIVLSIGVKLVAAQLLVWEVDYVPLIARGTAWLDGGSFPVVGTLSSVAAYNLPFLVWLQLPALFLTRHVPTVLIATQLAFNLLATVATYRLGRELIDERAGMVAAALFTYSQVGISSAYTAWAQLLLPGFCVFFVYCLYRWKTDGSAGFVALTWLVATAAFMTHFSAVLFYGLLAALWLILRLPWNARGLLAGALLSAAMLTPYMAFQVEQDFADLRAFFTRSPRIDAQTLAQYAHLKPEAQSSPAGAPPPVADASPSDDAPAPEPSLNEGRLQRSIRYALSLPGHALAALRLPFQAALLTLGAQLPPLAPLELALRLALEACFWVGCGFAIARCWRAWRGNQTIPALLRRSVDGRALLLMLVMLGLLAGLLLARATPDENASYYMSLYCLQFLVCAYSLRCLAGERRYILHVCLVLVLLWASFNSLDRLLRVAGHDAAQHSAQNMSLYRSIEAATNFIAADWEGGETLTISYDLLPELAHQWWIVPWHSIDPLYRMGMAYDFLLESAHGLRNRNEDPLGVAAGADYVLTSQPGATRYDTAAYHLQRFGAVVVLKRNS